ncbi:MAG: ATP-binding protein [Paracoccus sp. (in: a-proteobacteria)]|uniref:hybrid sensor histidine kinase/response regulator n=1 Tax=Paracoccus sp. TaxID=267 RepID=UPI0039E4FE88
MMSARVEAMRSAQVLVPFLALPALLGALWLALSPHALDDRVLVLTIGSAVMAWYLLGVAISGLHFRAAAIRRREVARLRSAVASHAGAALLVEPGGRVLQQNDIAVGLWGDMLGGRIADLLGRSHADPEQVWHDIATGLRRTRRYALALAQGQRFRVTPTGADLQLWLADVPTDPPAPVALPSGGDDFDGLPVSILMLDASGMILRANSAARELLGGVEPGQPLSALVDGLGREIGDWVSDVCAGRTVGGTEVLHLRGDGPDRFVKVSLAQGGAQYVTAILSDASALKTLEAQFVQSQKMQAIGQLAGGIAHDFNNLLTAITGHCDLLMLRHDKADPDYADLDQISQNANRAAALVRQLLAFSRKQTLKLQIMDLRDTLSDLTHLLNRLVGERIVLTFDHDPHLRMIRADRRQLEQVLMNLVVNARDAMPQGGDIVISTDNLWLDDVTEIGRATLPKGDYVRVQVCDQGCGIAPEELSKIFEPFYTTKRLGEGTGLGLSTAYGIVKQTGGYIFCDSLPGQGSTFSLFFPAHDRSEMIEVPEQPARPIALPKGEQEITVLLVEDEAPVRAFASRALKLQGFNVLEAGCAEDALSLLSDQRLAVDVFVTDVVMPGMDGPTWVRTALRDRPQTRVIFMSGYAEDVFAESRSPVPDAAFLAKPFSLSDLTALVVRQLEVQPREAAP